MCLCWVAVYTYPPSTARLLLGGLFRVRTCLFVSLRLRGVERRGHTEPATKPIHQTAVTSERRSQLRTAAHALWTLQLFLFAAFLFASLFFSHWTQAHALFFGVGGLSIQLVLKYLQSPKKDRDSERTLSGIL